MLTTDLTSPLAAFCAGRIDVLLCRPGVRLFEATVRMADAKCNQFRDCAELVARNDVQWLDPGVTLPTGSVWQRADVAPVPGTERWFKIECSSQLPSIGDELWTGFMPALAAVNGWEDDPAGIPGSAFVRCRVGAVEADRPQSPTHRWLRVEVVDIIPFGDLERRFPARPMLQLETWQLSTGALTRYKDWELWFAPHDDAGYWLLARLNEEHAHVVAADEWLFGTISRYSEAWAGHVLLPVAAWRKICQQA